MNCFRLGLALTFLLLVSACQRPFRPCESRADCIEFGSQYTCDGASGFCVENAGDDAGLDGSVGDAAVADASVTDASVSDGGFDGGPDAGIDASVVTSCDGGLCDSLHFFRQGVDGGWSLISGPLVRNEYIVAQFEALPQAGLALNCVWGMGAVDAGCLTEVTPCPVLADGGTADAGCPSDVTSCPLLGDGGSARCFSLETRLAELPGLTTDLTLSGTAVPSDGRAIDVGSLTTLLTREKWSVRLIGAPRGIGVTPGGTVMVTTASTLLAFSPFSGAPLQTWVPPAVADAGATRFVVAPMSHRADDVFVSTAGPFSTGPERGFLYRTSSPRDGGALEYFPSRSPSLNYAPSNLSWVKLSGGEEWVVQRTLYGIGAYSLVGSPRQLQMFTTSMAARSVGDDFASASRDGTTSLFWLADDLDGGTGVTSTAAVFSSGVPTLPTQSVGARAYSLALSGGVPVVGTLRDLVLAPTDAGAVRASYTPNLISPPRHIVLSGGRAVAITTTINSGSFIARSFDWKIGTDAGLESDAGPYRYVERAPVAVARGSLYGMTTTGISRMVDDGGLVLASHWSLGGLDGGFAVEATVDVARTLSQAQDCTRGGVLYVIDNANQLRAIAIDQPGIDTTADWPRSQHDPGNTSSADMPLTNWGCP